jgi:hypothetical protein
VSATEPITAPAAGPVLAYLILGGPVPTFMLTEDIGITTKEAGEALHQLRRGGYVRVEYGPGGTHVAAVDEVPGHLPWRDDL